MLKSNKNKTGIFLFTFILICIIITAIAIYITNEEIITLPQKEIKQEEQKKSIKPDGLGIKTLEDKYKPNTLELTNESYYPYPQIKQNEYYEYYPVEVNYVQISGLKNTSIQNKINQEIKETALSQIDYKEPSEKEIRQICITAMCRANFSNVLSIEIEKLTIYEDDYVSTTEFIGLNYNLKTGEKINFSDLFTNDAGTKNIIAQSAYISFAREYLWHFFEEDDYWDGDMNKIDYSSIEDRTFKILQNYDRNNKYQFYFDEKYIYVNINNEEIRIEMRKFYNQIAIYNRFANYTGILKKEPEEQIYVFTIRNDSDYEIYQRLEKIEDNLFVDIELFNWTDEDAGYTINATNYIKELEEKITECTNYLATHKNEAIVLAAYSELNNGENFYENGEVIERTYSSKAIMSKKYFNDTYLYKVLEWKQTDHLGGDAMSSNLMFLLMEDSEENLNINVEIDFPYDY